MQVWLGWVSQVHGCRAGKGLGRAGDGMRCMKELGLYSTVKHVVSTGVGSKVPLPVSATAAIWAALCMPCRVCPTHSTLRRAPLPLPEASWPTAPAASCDAASGTAPVLTAAAAAATTSAVAFTATPVPPPSAPFGNTEATAAGEEGQGEDEGEAREGGSRAAHLPERPDACAAGCAAAAAGEHNRGMWDPSDTWSAGPAAWSAHGKVEQLTRLAVM